MGWAVGAGFALLATSQTSDTALVGVSSQAFFTISSFALTWLNRLLAKLSCSLLFCATICSAFATWSAMFFFDSSEKAVFCNSKSALC